MPIHFYLSRCLRAATLLCPRHQEKHHVNKQYRFWCDCPDIPLTFLQESKAMDLPTGDISGDLIVCKGSPQSLRPSFSKMLSRCFSAYRTKSFSFFGVLWIRLTRSEPRYPGSLSCDLRLAIFSFILRAASLSSCAKRLGTSSNL